MSRRMIAPGVWRDEDPRPGIPTVLHISGAPIVTRGNTHNALRTEEAQRVHNAQRRAARAARTPQSAPLSCGEGAGSSALPVPSSARAARVPTGAATPLPDGPHGPTAGALHAPGPVAEETGGTGDVSESELRAMWGDR